MDYARILLALIAVVSLIGAFAFAARKAGLAQFGARTPRRRRLEIVESLFLEPRRRAVILKCDGREHLVLLGPAGETVVEHCLPGAVTEHDAPDAAAPVPATSFADTWKRLSRRDHGAGLPDAA